MLKDGEDYFAHEKEVWNQFIEEIKISLAINEETYVDATHINERSRAKLFRALGSSMYGVELTALYFKIPLEVALARNENRSGFCAVSGPCTGSGVPFGRLLQRTGPGTGQPP